MEIQWPLVLFTLFTGMGGCLAFFMSVDCLINKQTKTLRTASIAAIGLIIVGGLCSAAHLAHPLRAAAMVLHPKAGIFLEACLLGVLVVLLIALLVLDKKKPSSSLMRGVMIASLIVGVALSFFSGDSYMMPAHPAWNTILLPLSYSATAFVAGGGCYLLISKQKDAEPSRLIIKILFALSLVAIVCLIAYGIAVELFGGDFTGLILVIILLSGLVPAICSLVSLKKYYSSLTVIILTSAAIGGLLFRVLMWLTYSYGIAETSIALL